MDELSTSGAVIESVTAARWMLRWPAMARSAGLAIVVSIAFVSSLHAQSPNPVGQPPPPRGVYTPAPVYRPEWAKQGLTGKGVVLVTIDKQSGNVTGVRMLTSTGNQQLDGAALQAYSQWRFDPKTVSVSQLKIPIEFAKRPASPKPAKRNLPQPVVLLVILALAVAVIGLLKRRRA